jgi:hypothetical protein
MNRYSKWAFCVTICALLAASLHYFSGAIPRQNPAKTAAQSAAVVTASSVTVSADFATSNSSVAKPRPIAEVRTTPTKLSISATAPSTISSTGASTAPASPSRVSSIQIPLSFEENRGQSDSRVKYLARGKGYTLFLTPDEAVLALRYQPAAGKKDLASRQPGVDSSNGETSQSQANVRLSLAGANGTPHIEGLDQQQGISNYFIGNDPSQWHTQIPNYGRVLYQGVYPGVDVAYYGNQGQLETDFIVAPEADAKTIKLAVEGASSLRVNESGDLLLSIDGGEVRLKKPFAYQAVNGTRREISVAYQLLAKNEAAFELGAYDHSQKLIIDPALFFSTYLGGSGQEGDVAHAVAADGNGDSFVTGQTTSTNFPANGGFQTSPGGSGAQNAFVTEYAPDGQSLVFSTYLGGEGTDSGNAIAVNSTGQVYVAGSTTSTGFPTHNPLANQGALLGGEAAFVSQISANGATLLFSTYLSGNNVDLANGIALDSTENIYVVGGTASTNFPNTNAFQVSPGGGEDGFITKLAAPNPGTNPGSTILYSSYIGGSSFDQATAIAVSSTGDAFVAGFTTSADFPTVAPFQSSLGGAGTANENGWVAEVKQANIVPTVLFATYLGGSLFDQINGIAIDSSEDVYVTGFTESPDFPLQNALQTFSGGQEDAFVTEFAPGGGSLLFSTFFGGTGSTVGNAIALDTSKNIYFAGSTTAPDYPTRIPLVATVGTFFGNAVVTEISPQGSTGFLFSSYLGGSDPTETVFPGDSANGIAVDPSGNIYLVGATSTFDFSTVDPHQTAVPNTSETAFVARIGTGSANMLSPVALNLGSSVVGTAATTQRMSFEQATQPAATISSIALSGTNPGDFAEFDTCGSTLPISVVCEITITFTPSAVGTRTAVGTITTSAGTFNFNLSGTGIQATPPPPNGTLSISPGQLTFGATEITTLDPTPQSINVQNTGTTPVTLSSISTSGTNASDFFGFLTGASCSGSNTIPSGATCQVQVSFAPQAGAVGTRTASMTLTGNFTTSPFAISLTGTATVRIASLAPDPVQFANTVVNATSAVVQATLTNNSAPGGASLTGITNSVTAPFAISSSVCTQVGTLAPGATCTISLTFKPTSAALDQFGTLTVMSSDLPVSVSLFGNGLAANATLQVPIPRTNFSFGRATVGSTSNAQSVDLINIGNTNLTFTLPAGGANPNDFTATPQSSTNCTIASSISIAPGGDCLVLLTFTPTATGPRFGTITVQSGAANTPVTLTLSGTGDAPTTADFLPSPLIFPVTAVGSQSADELAILSNTGITADRLGFPTLGGTNAGDFQIDFPSGEPFQANCVFNTILNAQATCFVAVRFNPTATGLRTATLSIPDTATGNPHTIQLQGGQATGAPIVSFNVNPAAFGNQTINTASGQLTVTLTNTGTAALNLTNVSALGGTNPGDFAVLNTTTCINGANLAASGSCVLNLTFTPTALGARSALITFTDNAADSPETLTLTGTGTAASGGLTITTTSLPNGALNGAYGQTLQVTGGTPPFTFSITAGALPAGLTLGATSGSIGGVPTGTTGTSSFTVKVTDSSSPTPQTATANLSITINAADATNNSELNGHYAFVFSGFKDNGGTMEVVAASFTADGQGNITNGAEDNDDATGAQPSQTFTGTYAIGADNRGTMALTTQGGTVILAFAVGDIQSGVATKARLIRFDDASGTNGHTGSGVMFKQDPTAFTLGSIKGNYAFGESGLDDKNVIPESAVGFVTADGNGNFTTGLTDVNSGGNLVTSAAITGTYATTANTASNGRFTTSFTIAGVPGTFVDNMYVISANQAIFISLNSTANSLSVFSGSAQLQVPPAGGFGLGSISGNSVFATQGRVSAASTLVNVGAANADGDGNFSIAIDRNAAGTSGSGTASGTYTVASNGRGVFTFATSSVGNLSSTVVYLDGLNQGFLAPTDGQASFGSFEPGGSGFTNASLSGNYFIGTVAPQDSQVGDTSGVASFDGVGTIQGTTDESDPGGVLVGDQANSQPYAVASNGRFTITGQSNTIIGYVASACSFKTISSNGSNSGIVAGECQAQATAPQVSLSATSLTFPATDVADTSSVQTVTVTNTGNANLTFSALTPTGDFAVVVAGSANPACAIATPLTPTSKCDISVVFTPTAAGTRNGTLSIADNAANSPQVVTLTGTGIAVGPNITITPSTTVNFGNQLINTTSGSITTTVTNTGNQAITLTSVTLSPLPNGPAGTNPDGFAIVGNNLDCGAGTNLAAGGGSCVLPVTFGPTATGAVSSTITLSDSAGSQVITLNGTGIAPTITLNPTSLTLSTAPDTTSAAQTVTVNNSGAAPLHIANVTLGGTDAADFAFVNGTTPCAKGVTVQPQAACTIGVDFTAPSQATFTATVTVTSDASNGVQTIPLTGTGVVISITPPPGGSTTATTNPGGTAVFPLVLSSTGITGTATLTCTSPATPTITCNVVPGTVALTPNGVTHTAIVVNTFCKGITPTGGSMPGNAPRNLPPAPWLIAIVGLALLASMAMTKKRSLRLAMPLAVLLLAGIFASSCGSPPKGPNGITPPGVYPLVITATVGQASSSITLTLTVN